MLLRTVAGIRMWWLWLRRGEINHTNTGNTIQNQSRVNTCAVINMSSVHKNLRDHCFSFDLQLGGNTESNVKFYLKFHLSDSSNFKENSLTVLKYVASSTFFSSQITHGLITRNVFSINYPASSFITFLPLSLSRLNLKNCYFCHLSTQTWLLAESALFANSLPHLFYQKSADLGFFWQGLILVILPFPADVKPGERDFSHKWFIEGVKDLRQSLSIKISANFQKPLIIVAMCKILVIANYFCRGHDL